MLGQGAVPIEGSALATAMGLAAGPALMTGASLAAGISLGGAMLAAGMVGHGRVDMADAAGEAMGGPDASGAGLWAMTLAVAPTVSMIPRTKAIGFGRFIRPLL